MWSPRPAESHAGSCTCKGRVACGRRAARNRRGHLSVTPHKALAHLPCAQDGGALGELPHPDLVLFLDHRRDPSRRGPYCEGAWAVSAAQRVCRGPSGPAVGGVAAKKSGAALSRYGDGSRARGHLCGANMHGKRKESRTSVDKNKLKFTLQPGRCSSRALQC